MNDLFAQLLVVGLVTRFALLPDGRPVGPGRAALLGLLLAGLLLLIDFAWPMMLIAGGYAGVVIAVLYLAEIRRAREAPGVRLLMLLGHVAMLAMCMRGFASYQHSVSPLGLPLSFVVWFGGVLLCLKEGNFFIRWFFGRLKRRNGETGNAASTVADSQTDNGRVIGALERLLIFLLLLAGHNMAIPAVIAVKALARFKKMEESQAFAEYVIIGTFLSILITLGIHAAAQQLVG
ncbi:MAG: hypothetical protein ABII82_07650 [Verrucomicrobiota bacterium]